MAASPFPQRKSQGAGGMTSGGMTSILDGPPPSPAQPDPTIAPGGMQMPPPSFAEMAQPLTAGTPGRAIPQEVAMGILESAQSIFSMLDSMASIVPDLANEFAMQKDLLQRTMAKLVTNAGTVAPASALGQNFPGGGFQMGAR